MIDIGTDGLLKFLRAEAPDEAAGRRLQEQTEVRWMLGVRPPQLADAR